MVDNLNWVITLTKNLGESRIIQTYLKKKYGKFHNLTVDAEKALQSRIIQDHKKEDIRRMLNRIEGSINIAKDTQSLTVQPFSFFMVLLTAFSSVTVGMVTASLNLFNGLLNKYIGDKEITKDQLIQMINSLDMTPIFKSAILAVAAPFVVIILWWIFFFKRTTKKIDKNYVAYTLLKECIEEYDKVKIEIIV